MLTMIANMQDITDIIRDAAAAFLPAITPLTWAFFTISCVSQFFAKGRLRNELAETRHKLATANAALSYTRAIAPDAERACDFVYDYLNRATSIEQNFPEWPAYHKDYVELDMGSYA